MTTTVISPVLAVASPLSELTFISMAQSAVTLEIISTPFAWSNLTPLAVSVSHCLPHALRKTDKSTVYTNLNTFSPHCSEPSIHYLYSTYHEKSYNWAIPGTSALYTGERRPKDDQIFEALGTTDELTSHLGMAREYCDTQNNGLSEKLEVIQCLLQDIGSNIATPKGGANEFKRELSLHGLTERTKFDENGSHVKDLEDWIDELDRELPPLKNFILPSGGLAASSLHIARSVCRRAERRVHPLIQLDAADASTGKYLNRLSDYLFMAARYAAKYEGKEETVYKKPRSSSD
ncbi:hypothetical protein INT43_000331 [Umbelopsis isabellina]|uniref:Corrinoid adenosyltransferase MMAB n=1 Tax=Mortierella isabellina TaxID=91625 RepID=A0A8H7Q1K4_MORIS|nr:hypothetical protein INT43_000331 [Umbelopsis isabellina]